MWKVIWKQPCFTLVASAHTRTHGTHARSARFALFIALALLAFCWLLALAGQMPSCMLLPLPAVALLLAASHAQACAPRFAQAGILAYVCVR